MLKLMTLVVGVAALCGTMAFAQTSAPATTAGENPEGRFRPPPPGGDPEMQLIINAIRDAAQNPALVPLLNQALTDRTTLLQSEIARVAQLQALLTAIQGGNKAAIQSAREALRTASETVEANMKTFREDCRAIREHMRR
ncbi:MAG: hypothetical protein ABSA67_05830 [Candidatus Brocadiia bacterium]|jgi:hypothetical protein